MNYKPIFEQVSKETGISEEVVKTAYNLFWRFVRETASSLPLKDELTEEEFMDLKCNFNIPSLGKLCCTYDRYIGMKKRNKYLMELRRRR